MRFSNKGILNHKMCVKLFKKEFRAITKLKLRFGNNYFGVSVFWFNGLRGIDVPLELIYIYLYTNRDKNGHI